MNLKKKKNRHQSEYLQPEHPKEHFSETEKEVFISYRIYSYLGFTEKLLK